MTQPNCLLYERCFSQEKDALLVKLLLSDKESEGGLFQQIKTEPFKNLVQWKETPEFADYLFLPTNYSSALKSPGYIDEFRAYARRHSLVPIITMHGDYLETIDIPEAIILRTSTYRSEILSNETIIPAFVEDLGENNSFSARRKTNKIPTIGFSGMVNLPNIKKELRYKIRVVLQWIKIHLLHKNAASYQGLFYRRRVINTILKTKLVEGNFAIRKTWSRSKKSIEGNPQKIRKEFVESIKNADLALVVRGDGNYSLRLFEVLSLGRIPLFIDTDSPLPLESEIDYDSFMLRVDHTQIHRLPEIVHEWWQNISPEEYIQMQKRAREVFETKLRVDVFYKHFFSNLALSRK